MKFIGGLIAGWIVRKDRNRLSPSTFHGVAESVPPRFGSVAPPSLATRAQFFRSQLLNTTILIIAAATAVIAPMLVLGTVAGRDFPFHLASWMDVAKQWHQGTIYPQWAELANWGLGEPRFVFYPPGSWMIGAALGCLFPWTMVPTLFNWLALIGAGFSMYLLARQALPQRQAALAAMFFAANPYHLLLVYYRSDFAELLASAFFPLLPWGVARIARNGWRDAPILALVVALIWLSNAPIAVIAVYSVVFLFLVAYAAVRDLRLLLYGAVAVAAGFGLAAFYILPAAHQRSWVQINHVLSDGLRPEQNFLFSRATSMAVNTSFNLKISCVALLMGLLIAAVAIYLAKSPALPRLHYWLVLALGAMSLFMMFRVSRPLWVLAPELHFVQFPWRYAVPLGVAFSFLLAAACRSRNLEILAVFIFVLAGPLAKIGLAMERPSSWNKAEISRFQENVERDGGYRGTPEYLPNSANSQIISPESDIQKADDASATSNWNTDWNTLIAETTSPMEIALRAFNYPTRQVDLDGSPSSKLTDGDGRIVVRVPAGKHYVQVYGKRGWDAEVGIAVSVSTAVLFSTLMFLPLSAKNSAALRQTDLESSISTPSVSTNLPVENQERG